MKLNKKERELYKAWLYTFLVSTGIHLIWNFLFLKQRIKSKFGNLEVQIIAFGCIVAILAVMLRTINKEKSYVKGAVVGAVSLVVAFAATSFIFAYQESRMPDMYTLGRVLGYAFAQGIVSGLLLTHLQRQNTTH